MNHKRILEAVIAGVAVWAFIEWYRKQQGQSASNASFTGQTQTNATQGVMA